MPSIRHTAIVVTSWDMPALLAAAEHAKGLELQVLGPSKPESNAISSILICPSGSAWASKDPYSLFIKHLNSHRYEDGSNRLQWVCVSFGGDEEPKLETAFFIS